MIKKNTLVQIYKVVLTMKNRSANLPSDTKEVPFEMRIKGRLLKAANLGDQVEIITASNRIESGILIADKPHYNHSFGHHIQILEDVKEIILKETEGL